MATEGTVPEANGTTVAGGVEELLSHASAVVATINGLLETATSASTGITDAQKLTAIALTDA